MTEANANGTKTNGNRPKGPRCIALVGPFQSGKTTLLEALLARTGARTINWPFGFTIRAMVLRFDRMIFAGLIIYFQNCGRYSLYVNR